LFLSDITGFIPDIHDFIFTGLRSSTAKEGPWLQTAGSGISLLGVLLAREWAE